jgi:GDPmannose 4,6-dehydratase
MQLTDLRGATALITGVTGQDGYYLVQSLADAGMMVHGVVAGVQNAHDTDKAWTRPEVCVHTLDLSHTAGVVQLLRSVRPDYVFHLAGMSSVAESWRDPVRTIEVNALSTTALLDACVGMQESTGEPVVVVNASSGEVFDGSIDSPQSETTPVKPTSPYGASKALGHMMCQIYRSKGLEASNAILYNHESPRRPPIFVTRKITMAAAAIAQGRQDTVSLGSLLVRRDWGWAPDYVDAMVRIAAHGKGDDFVIATGVSHSIADFAAAAFSAVGISDWRAHVVSDPDLVRPTESADMVGDARRAHEVLGWTPTKSFDEIVSAMVNHDLELMDLGDAEPVKEPSR